MQFSEIRGFQRIIIFPLFMVVLVTVCGFLLIDLYLEKTSKAELEESMIRLAQSGAEMTILLDDGADLLEFDYLADKFAENSTFRATVIGVTGTVLGDSRLSLAEVRTIENHADRPEIMMAREQGIGISNRYSSTLKVNLLYVAKRFHNENLEGYFRVALPLSEVQQERLSRRLILAAFAFAALLLAVVISLISSGYILSVMRQARADLEERVDKRSDEIATLQNLGTQLTACNSRDEALEVLTLTAALLLPRFNGSLALFRASRDKLEIEADWNGDWADSTSYAPDQCWALRTGKPHLGNPAKGNMKCNHSHIEQQQMLCLPLVAQGETHGVLHLASDSEAEWSAEEHQLAAAVAEQASLTFASLDLRESLRQQAIKDPLTGLYNRRYLLETLEHELGRAERQGSKLSVIMLDLDHFKKFNDDYGHEIGDFILSEFGRLVRLHKRKMDVACRYGGEEFTLLLPDTDIDQAKLAAERIGREVREHDFHYAAQAYGPITFSAGIATFPFDGTDGETLLKKSDEALYLAKEAGRDRAVHVPKLKIKDISNG